MPKLKELTYYNTNNHCDVLADTIYHGVRYICFNRGFHPTCYVFCTKDFLDKHVTGVDYIPGITVHGGVTYTGKINKLQGLGDFGDDYCFGWDYGHAGDWEGYMTESSNITAGNHKYTTDLIIKDCESVISQYLDILHQDEMEAEKNNPKDVVEIVKKIPNTPTPLTKEYLKNLGFHSIYSGIAGDDESSMLLHGEANKGKWKIFICFTSPSKTYAFNDNPRKRYEGSIETVEDLKMVIGLCRIPLKV